MQKQRNVGEGQSCLCFLKLGCPWKLAFNWNFLVKCIKVLFKVRVTSFVHGPESIWWELDLREGIRALQSFEWLCSKQVFQSPSKNFFSQKIHKIQSNKFQFKFSFPFSRKCISSDSSTHKPKQEGIFMNFPYASPSKNRHKIFNDYKT